MTIKDLPILDSIKAHFLAQNPLDNDLIMEAQSKDYCIEIKSSKPEYWKIKENKLALLMKQSQAAFLKYKKSAVNKYGEDYIQNAGRYLQCILAKRSVPNAYIHIAVISWFIFEIIDVDQTLKANNWLI